MNLAEVTRILIISICSSYIYVLGLAPCMSEFLSVLYPLIELFQGCRNKPKQRLRNPRQLGVVSWVGIAR